MHSSRVAKSSTTFDWSKGRDVSSVGWQVTFCDPVWHVSSCSGVAMFHCKLLYPYTDAHQFNGPLSGTTRVSRYQKGKTNLDFTEARDSEWQWHQLGHMQVCTSLKTDNHASTPPLSFYRPNALPATQPTSVKALKAQH